MPRVAVVALLLLTGCGQAGSGGGDRDMDPGTDGAVTPDTPRVTAGLDAAVRRHVERAGEDVLTRWGACPFECCVYREWLAESDIPVLAEPRADGAVLTTIPSGERFQADTGFVRVTSPQLVVVSAPVEAYRIGPDAPVGGEPASFAAGDTLLVLDYVGEGYFNVLRAGELYSTPQFWPGEDGWPSGEDVKGEVTGEYAAEWWVRVRTGDGVEGWIDSYGAAVGDADACA